MRIAIARIHGYTVKDEEVEQAGVGKCNRILFVLCTVSRTHNIHLSIWHMRAQQ